MLPFLHIRWMYAPWKNKVIIVLDSHVKGWKFHIIALKTNQSHPGENFDTKRTRAARHYGNQTKQSTYIFYCRAIKVQKEYFFEGPKQNIIDLKGPYQIYEKRETIFSLNSHKSLASLVSVANSIGLSSLQSDKYLPLTPSKSGWSAA